MVDDSHDLESRILSIVLDFYHTNKLNDVNDFSIEFSRILTVNLTSGDLSESNLSRIVRNIKTTFFQQNSISKKEFIRLASLEVLPKILRLKTRVIITITELLPEIKTISDEKAKELLPRLDIEEKVLQKAFRKILRAKGAFPIPQRFRDTAQEIADIEIFRIQIKNAIIRMAVIVKGYRSISSKTVTWKDIAHQITRAYQRGQPDYILLVIAKEPTDGLITILEEYSRNVNKPSLFLMMTPIDLIKFLYANHFIMKR